MTQAITKPAEQEREAVFLPFLAKEEIKLNVSMILRFFAKPTVSGQVCSPEQAFKFIMLCKSRALNPWEGDAYIVGYDTKNGPEFNLITAHQAFLKRAEAHAAYEGMESGVIVRHDENEETKDLEGDFIPEGTTLVGGWARVHRKDRKIPCLRRLSLASYAKPFGVWISNPATMIVKCAEADALRASFPNTLSGMYNESELAPIVVSAPPSIPVNEAPPRRMSMKAPPTAAPAISDSAPIPGEPNAEEKASILADEKGQNPTQEAPAPQDAKETAKAWAAALSEAQLREYVNAPANAEMLGLAMRSAQVETVGPAAGIKALRNVAGLLKVAELMN